MAKKVVRGEVVVASVELTETQGDAKAIATFLRGLVPFFERARALEARAREVVAAVKTAPIVVPQTKEADAVLLAEIRGWKAERAESLEHWNPVTQMFSALHRRMTGARNRTDDLWEGVITDATLKHATFEREERQRAEDAARESERLERERLEREREAELARLDAVALDAEAASAELSDRERVFVAGIAKGVDTVEAARLAGYRDPKAMGPRLMAYTKILDAIRALEDAAAAKRQADAVRATPVTPTTTAAAPQLNKGTRYTIGVEIVDESALLAAVLAGDVPRDILAINPAKVRQYAQAVKGELAWPGVRVTKTPVVV